MFGVLASGRLVDTNVQQATENEFVLTLEQVEHVNHVVVFLTGQVPFAEGFGGSIYFGWPVGGAVSWQLLGFISNEKPSAIFKLAKVKPSVSAPSPFGAGLMDTVGVLASTTALIAIQVQPLSEIIQQTPAADTQIPIPRPVDHVPSSLDEIPAEMFARQLTWVEHELYSRIKPYEFLQQKWTKKNRQELAPNICYVIYRFNHMTLWIAKEIMSHDQPRQRFTVIQKMIQIAKHCFDLHNFVTVFQIMAALVSSSVQRLKKTWDLLPSSVHEQFMELKKLASVEGGSKVYRERQKSSPSPSVPYIGPYLHQLVSIEVGMPTFVQNPPEHVNFLKLTKLAAVIEEVMRFQNPKYDIKADGPVLSFIDQVLESASEFDEEQRYSRSIQLEPRKQGRKKSLAKPFTD